MNARDALERLIRWVMRDSIYLAAHPAVVVTDHGDAVSVSIESGPLAGALPRVPVLSGLAGGTATAVEPGTRCLVRFEAGDPSRPRVVAWGFDRDSAVVHLDRGGRSIARVGDVVRMPAGPSLPVTGTLVGMMTVQPPPPSPPVPTPIPPGTTFTGTMALPPSLYGTIVSGARKVTA